MMWKSSPIKSTNDIKRGIVLPSSSSQMKKSQALYDEETNPKQSDINHASSSNGSDFSVNPHLTSKINQNDTFGNGTSDADENKKANTLKSSDPIDSIYARILETSADMYDNSSVEVHIDTDTLTSVKETTAASDPCVAISKQQAYIDDHFAPPMSMPSSMFDDDDDHIVVDKINGTNRISNTVTNSTATTTTTTKTIYGDQKHPGDSFDYDLNISDPIIEQLLDCTNALLSASTDGKEGKPDDIASMSMQLLSQLRNMPLSGLCDEVLMKVGRVYWFGDEHALSSRVYLLFPLLPLIARSLGYRGHLFSRRD